MADVYNFSERLAPIDQRSDLPLLILENSIRTSCEQYHDNSSGAGYVVSHVHAEPEDNDDTAAECGKPIWNGDTRNQPESSNVLSVGAGSPDQKPINSMTSDQVVFHPAKDFHAQRDSCTPRFTWLNVGIVCICSISTALSAIFVLLASKSQRYGNFIGSNPGSKMEASTAILLTSVIAKTIELTFVTAFVAFLGQITSRKALTSVQGSGVTLAEMSMWRWVVQPGTLFTQPEIARYSALSIVGVLTLLTTVLSTLYVTAATAVVQPVTRESQWHMKTMAGSVKSDFASIVYSLSQCQTPVNASIDPDYSRATCSQLQHAGRSSYNLGGFLETWAEYASTGNGSSIQQQRPAQISIPYLNSTVVPQWINITNTTEASHKYGRIINQISLALPHVGVVNAVHDQQNKMPRSGGSDSIGPYSLWASVPSPVINVLCVHMNETELSPIVYSAWPNNDIVNSTTWSIPGLQGQATTTNATVVDAIFDWTKKDTKTMLDYPPVFAEYPKPFNTIMNSTTWTWGRSGIYLLGGGTNETDGSTGSNHAAHFPICRIQVGISSNCSTRFSISVAGSKVEALCDDSAEDMAFIKVQSNASSYAGIRNWQDVGTDWSNSLSLSSGNIVGGKSLSRLLMQFALAPGEENNVDLNPLLPSLAEALAVLASDTAVLLWRDATFKDHWIYTDYHLENGTTEYFTAKIKSQEYASGGVDEASKAWLIVLIATFLLNVMMLAYFIKQPGLVTDFSQPPQLFALAINSPPARAFAGSSRSGPEGKQYKVNWIINQQEDYLYITPK